jgi:hypothetical protein
MKINITAKMVLDDKLGRLNKDQVVDLVDHKARFYIETGMAELYETKVLRDRPSMVAGTPLSASPVAQALQEQTLNLSENGEKKPTRRRKTKAL